VTEVSVVPGNKLEQSKKLSCCKRPVMPLIDAPILQHQAEISLSCDCLYKGTS